MKLIEFADLVDVPILKAGTHQSHNKGAVTITEDELDEIIEGSQELLPVVKGSLSTGVYEGNEDLKLPKMPGLLNLHHNTLFGDTIKDRVKAVDVSFGKQEIDGETWMTESFHNVPHDIAATLQSSFPFRSVELIPLKNPKTGKEYPMVVRSTAFLDKYTPPAVKGQNKDFLVEFEGETPVIVLLSQGAEYKQEQEEDNDMPIDGKTPDVNPDVAELQGKYVEQATELAAQKAKNEALELEQGAANTKIAELQAKSDSRDVSEFIGSLSTRPIHGADGVIYNVSTAFCKVVEPLISRTSTSAVFEMEEGEKPARSVIMETIDSIVEMAATDGGFLVAMSEMAGKQHEPPDDTPKTAAELQAELMAADESLTPAQAWVKTQEQLKTYEGGN